MTEAIKAEGTTVYNILNFVGFTGTLNKDGHVKTCSLKKYLETYFNNYYQITMKDFFECKNHYFDCRQADIEDIFNWIEKGYMIIPFSSNIKKKEVLQYINAGFNVLFMRPAEYKAMKKAYKEYC